VIIDLTLLAVAVVLYWAWKTRDPQAMRISDILAVIAALVGLKLLNSHSPLGIVGLGAAGWWFWFRKGGKLGRRAARNPDGMTHEEARRLLDVPFDASTEEIRAAHRRLVSRVHPDVGGSADLTRQVNAARDTLLRHRG
jgi:DnaJ homolog subfamily C member 19